MQATFVAAEHTTKLAELEALLAQAAEEAVRLGLDPDAFFAGVQAAYLKANPELRERLESAHLMAQMEELRRRGMVGQA